MTLWIVLTLMVALAVAGLAFPLARGRAAAPARTSTLDVLKGQLAEIEAQAAAGALSPEDAEGLRTEVKRRMLAEGREPDAPARPLSGRLRLQLAVAVTAATALAGTLLYARIGRPDLVGDSAPPPAAAAVASADVSAEGRSADVTAVIAQLEAQLKAHPDSAQGWRMLGWSYFQTRRFPDAVTAYARSARLEPSNAETLSAEGEAMVRAAGDRVTPDAAAVFRKALAADTSDPRARYFLAVLKDERGDHKGAMDDWIAMLRAAPPGAPWAQEVRDFVERVAKARGEDVSARLPPAPAEQPSVPALDAAQIAAAGQMSDADRQAMIDRMVGTLAARLKAQPHDPDGWMRLMRARMVLGQADQAAQAYRDAQRALTGAEQAKVREAAKSLGVPGA